MKRYDIFISYRRSSYESANLIATRLKAAGYSVFFDLESMRSGPFNVQLFNVIEECSDFVLVLPPDALERCHNEEDWVRKEVIHAMQHHKNIVPILLNGFHWPEVMPKGMEKLKMYQSVAASVDFFDLAMKRLESYLKSSTHPKQRIFVRWFGVILIAILALFLATYILNCRRIYQSNMHNTITEVFKYDSKLGASLLSESLPKQQQNDFSMKLISSGENIEPVCLLRARTLFNSKCVAINRNCSLIATIFYNDKVIIRELHDLDKDREIPISELPSMTGSHCIEFDQFDNSSMLVAYNWSISHGVVIYDLQLDRVKGEYKLDKSIEKARYKKNMIAVAGYSSITLIDETTKFTHEIENNPGYTIKNLEFSPCDSVLAIIYDTGIGLYDYNSRKHTHFIHGNFKYSDKPICYSDNGELIFIEKSKGCIAMYDAKTLNEISSIQISRNSLSSICYTPSGVIVGDFLGKLYSVDFGLDSYKLLPSMHETDITKIAYDQTGVYSYSNGVICYNGDGYCKLLYDDILKSELSAFYLHNDDTLFLGNGVGDLIINCGENTHVLENHSLSQDTYKDEIKSINRFSDSLYMVMFYDDIKLMNLNNMCYVDTIQDVYYYSIKDSNVYVWSYDPYVSLYSVSNNQFKLNNNIYPDDNSDIDIDAFLPLSNYNEFLYSKSNELFYRKQNGEVEKLFATGDYIESILCNKNKELIYTINDDDILECYSMVEHKVKFKLSKDVDEAILDTDGEYLITKTSISTIDIWDAISRRHLEEIDMGIFIEALKFDNNTNKLQLLISNYGIFELDIYISPEEFEKIKSNPRKLTEQELKDFNINSFYSLF